MRVKKVEEATEEYVLVMAELLIPQTEQTNQQKPPRMIQIGFPFHGEDGMEKVSEQVAAQIQKHIDQRLSIRKPIAAEICIFIKKEYFNYLGCPTVDDYIELNARTDKRH